MKKGLLLLAMFMLMAVSVNALTLKVNYGAPGYSTVSIVCTTADFDSGTTAKKLYIYYDKVKATTLVDSITTVTIPDTFAITGLDENATYYFKIAATDSGTTVTGDVESFTTKNYTQTVSTINTGSSYSTIGVMGWDTTGIGFILDSVVLFLDKTAGTTRSAVIGTVTSPDTFSVTGLDEGVTYYYTTVAWSADSGIVDTLAQGSFTTTNLSSSVTALVTGSSLILIVDSVGICPDSLIVQHGAGLAAIAVNADTVTTANCPDTITITGLIEGGVYSYRVLYFLADSSAIDTGTVGTYTRAHNLLSRNNNIQWPDNFVERKSWEFDSHLDSYTTGLLPIQSQWIRVHVAIDGEDDFATSDSINVFLWNHVFGDAFAIDTIVTLAADTTTITPLIYRMYPSDYSDTSLGLYPVFGWGTHYSVSASMSNDDGQGDSTTTLGIRTVFVIIEEIPLMSAH